MSLQKHYRNISEWEWQHGTSAALMYGFTYDGVNRLKETFQKQKSGTSWSMLPGSYLETGLTYDRNGNIQTLQRTAAGTTVDHLVYDYTGNRLTGLTENVASRLAGDVYSRGSAASGSYGYDKNGNMTNDSRRALNFSYNVLNLLSEVKTTGGELKARYLYLADGTKLRVRDNGEVNGYDYLGSLTYRKSDSGLQLESANFGEGVIRPGDSNSGQQEVDYFLTDHLGSVRLIVDRSGVVKERNDCDPFGARFVRGDYPQLAVNRFKYNGKEEQVTGSLGYLDYGWRMQDKTLSRWFGMDKLSEMMPSISGYAYALNNPVGYRDLFGLYLGKKDDPVWSLLLPEVVVKPDVSYVPSPDLYWYYPGMESKWDEVPNREDLEYRGWEYRKLHEAKRMNWKNVVVNWGESTQITMNYGIGSLGTYFSVKSGLRYTPDLSFGGIQIDGYWQAGKGNYYSLRVLEKQTNGKYVPGVNGLRISSTWAKGSARVSANLGYVLGGLSTTYSGVRFILKPNLEDGIDVTMGVAGIYYWPIGAIYFGGKLFSEGMLNYTSVMMANGLRPGMDDRNIWK